VCTRKRSVSSVFFHALAPPFRSLVVVLPLSLALAVNLWLRSLYAASHSFVALLSRCRSICLVFCVCVCHKIAVRESLTSCIYMFTHTPITVYTYTHAYFYVYTAAEKRHVRNRLVYVHTHTYTYICIQIHIYIYAHSG